MRNTTTPAKSLVILLAAVIVALGITLGSSTFSSSAGADSTSGNFYLDLGASASVGFQPTANNPHGEPTDQGYANDVVAYERDRGIDLQLTQLGCPGETTATMINGGDHCHHFHDSQLSEAMAFLSSHQNDEGIVTVDLGFNNILHCVFADMSNTCVNDQMAELRVQLPEVLESLMSVAGPGVSIVGLGHYDPYLSKELLGESGVDVAQRSASVIDELNNQLRAIYSDFAIPMAKVNFLFQSRDVRRVELAGVGVVPDNVAHICEFTWMCAPPPFGPNLHPNDAGYLAIASAIESTLPAPW